jgi:TPR repeat protein
MGAFPFLNRLAVLFSPTVTLAEIPTFTGTHTYILGDHDSKDDARQRCLLEAKRKVLEQAGVYIESASEVKNFDLAKDKITTFAVTVMQVKDTKEEVGFQQGHMTLTLTITAQVDLAEVRKHLAVRQGDASVPDDFGAQKEWLIKAQQGWEQAAAQGDAKARVALGMLYENGWGVPQDYAKARQWLEQAAAQGDAGAQYNLGQLYYDGQGVPQDYAKARQWYEQAAIQGHAKAQNNLGGLYTFGEGVPKDDIQAYMWLNLAAAHSMGDEQNQAADNRDVVARRMTPAQIAEAQKLAREWKPKK